MSDDPLRPHRHDPNDTVPAGDGSLIIQTQEGSRVISVARLQALPSFTLPGCYIVSTGHGTTGPFAFRGVRLIELIHTFYPAMRWREVEVVSGDGFGNRIFRHELSPDDIKFPPLLAYERDGAPLTRAAGLVRLIVPGETRDALRQVKWVAHIRIV